MFPLSFVERSQVVEVKGADDTLTRISSNFKLVAPARPHQKTIFKIRHLSNHPHQKTILEIQHSRIYLHQKTISTFKHPPAPENYPENSIFKNPPAPENYFENSPERRIKLHHKRILKIHS